jgi:hypothetical protein
LIFHLVELLRLVSLQDVESIIFFGYLSTTFSPYDFGAGWESYAFTGYYFSYVAALFFASGFSALWGSDYFSYFG